VTLGVSLWPMQHFVTLFGGTFSDTLLSYFGPTLLVT